MYYIDNRSQKIRVQGQLHKVKKFAQQETRKKPLENTPVIRCPIRKPGVKTQWDKKPGKVFLDRMQHISALRIRALSFLTNINLGCSS